MVWSVRKINSLKQWNNHLETLREDTRNSYLFLFVQFLEWIKLSPDELIMKASSEKHVIESQIRAYIKYLSEEGKQLCTQAAAYEVIKNFFESNHHSINLSALNQDDEDV